MSVLILFPEDDIKKASLIQPGRKTSGFKVFKKKEKNEDFVGIFTTTGDQ